MIRKCINQEEALRIIEGLPEIVSVLDLDLRFIYISPSVTPIRGLTVEEAMSQGIEDVIFPDDLTTINQLLAEELEAEVNGAKPRRSRQIEARHFKKNGEIIWMEIGVSFLRDEQQKPTAIIAISRDITERKIAEKKLRKSRDYVKTVLQSVIDGFWVVGENQRIIEVNESYCRMSGYSREELLSLSIEDLDAKEAKETIKARIERIMANGSEIFETTHQKKDGTVFEVEVSVTRLNLNGDFRLICFCRDITEKKIFQKSLIERERLQAIREMGGGAAHSLNNLLQVVSGNLEIVCMDPSIPPEAIRLIDEVQQSASKMTIIIRQLLDFIQKKESINPVPINLNESIEEAIDQVNINVNRKDNLKGGNLIFSFNKIFDSKIPFIDGDPKKLISVFYNLIKNATEAMPNGGVVTIETGKRDKEVFVRILDLGVGMEEDIKKRIFQPFFTTKGFEAGLGLGLPTTDFIVQSHGGKIEVRSEVGKGTVVEVFFPEGRLVSARSIPANPKRKKILWVDDEVVIADLGQMMLQRLGHLAFTAYSGQEALQILECGDYDLLITDLGMAKMDGSELVELAKGRFNIKAIVITGWSKENISPEREVLIDCFLTKPVDLADLRQAVESMFI